MFIIQVINIRIHINQTFWYTRNNLQLKMFNDIDALLCYSVYTRITIFFFFFEVYLVSVNNMY